jgi:hypothetical protein
MHAFADVRLPHVTPVAAVTKQPEPTRKPLYLRFSRSVRNILHNKKWRNIVIAGIALLFAGAIFLRLFLASAGVTTAYLVPDTDVTTQWTQTGGTSDNSCAGGTHCDFIDEGQTSDDTTYIGTGTALGDGVVEAYDMSTVSNIKYAKAVQLKMSVMSATNANGGTMDTLSVDISINGSSVLSTTNITPTFNTWSNQILAMVSGTWTQSDINSLRVTVTRVVAGSGSPSNQDDDIRISNITAFLSYVEVSNLNQSSYRFFDNSDSNPGGAMTFARVWSTESRDLISSGGQISPKDVAATNDGGFIVAGQSLASGFLSSRGAFLMKFTAAGELAWLQKLTTGGSDSFAAIRSTSDGGYIACGFGSTTNGITLAKITSNGSVSWYRQFGSTATEDCNNVTQLTDGGFALCGYTGTNANDALVAKFDSSGTLLWTSTWGGSAQDICYGIAGSTDGGVVIAGETRSYLTAGGGTNDGFLAKFDTSGTLLWNRTWGGSGGDSFADVKVTGTGNFIVSGQTSLGAGGFDLALAVYDSSGTYQWSRTWGGAADESSDGLTEAADGNYVIAGYSNSFGNDYEAVIVKYDTSGNLVWNRSFGGSSSDRGQGLALTNDGGFIQPVLSVNFGYGTNNMIIVKRDSTGNIAGCSSVCGAPAASSNVPASGTATPTATSGPGSGFSAVSATPTVPTLTLVVNDIVAIQPTVDVGSALAAESTPATSPNDGRPFRLRLGVNVTTSKLDGGVTNFKLQYAARGADNSCDTNFTNETYADVTTSTPVRYYDNTNASSGLGVATNANDPTDGGNTLVRQTYVESDSTTFTNPTLIPSGQTGLWDFALTTFSTTLGSHYCLRLVESSGTVLNTYSVIPEIISSGPNNSPAAPTLSAPSNTSTSVSITPTFQLRTTDTETDYVRYKIEVCTTSNCSAILRTIDQTSSQTGWTGQDAQTSTAYIAASAIGSSTLASHTYQPTALSFSTQYWWRAYAIDPGGSNTWSSASSIFSFTTSTPTSNTYLNGGTQIRGGTRIGN